MQQRLCLVLFYVFDSGDAIRQVRWRPLLRFRFLDPSLTPFYSRRSVRAETTCRSACFQRWHDWMLILGREASELARLPGETATQRLASLIAALPDEPSAHLDPRTIAARLIALLPRRARPNLPSRETLLSVGTATNSRAVISMIFICVIITILMMSAEWITANRQTPAQVDNAQAPASSAVFPQLPPSNSRR